MASKDQRSKKALVESIFLLQGKSYDEWLDAKHDELILEGSGAIRTAIINMKKNDTNTNTDTSEMEEDY